jgi:hypothetical protein
LLGDWEAEAVSERWVEIAHRACKRAFTRQNSTMIFGERALHALTRLILSFRRPCFGFSTPSQSRPCRSATPMWFLGLDGCRHVLPIDPKPGSQRTGARSEAGLRPSQIEAPAMLGSPCRADRRTSLAAQSQLELQAIIERGWLLTKAAEPATSTPMTTANGRNFIVAPPNRILSTLDWIL